MSGILHIQRTYARTYDIRLGSQTGGVPSKTNGEIRVTSPSMDTVKAFAAVYGGKPRRWNERGQFQVFLPTVRLPITILPGQALFQAMEHWQGGACVRRCNSEVMSTGDPCECGADLPIVERECKPVSRLTVACPEVPIVGTGRLTTRSAIAAGELDGAISMIQPMLQTGVPVSAILRVDSHKGTDRAYNVPRLEFTEGLSFNDLMEAANKHAALGPATQPAIERVT